MQADAQQVLGVTSIAVTGVHGTIGGRLLSRLSSDEGVGRLIAVDRAAPPLLPEGVEFVRADLRDAVLGRVIRNVDVVINAAFADDVTRDHVAALARRVQGTRRVLDAAHVAGVPALVHLSSALVYGACERNRVPLTEDQPLRVDPGFVAAHHALLAEESVRAFAGDHPDCRIVVLRTVPVLVPEVDSAVTRHLESPLLPQVRGFDPPVQFVDGDDLVEAVRLVALDARASGVYNVAAEGWLTSSDVRHLLARPGLHLPQQVAAGAATALHRLRLLPVPPAALDYLMHPWVVDTTRLHGLGWTPSASQRDILHRFVAEHRRWISLGRVRMRVAVLLAAVAAVWTAMVGGGAWASWQWWRNRDRLA